jgi:hypothetical protein
MAPKSPKSAPDAPTDMVFGTTASLKCKIDNKLPPKPESRYNIPISTANLKRLHIKNKDNKEFQLEKRL